jgi:CRP-like cAMP-binding protein
MLETLRRVPWLASLTTTELEAVAKVGSNVTFAAGVPLVSELEVGDDLFILLEGEARVTVSQGGREPRTVGQLRAGDVCGEIAVLTRELRSATVTATSPVQALRIGRAGFEALIKRHPAIATHFLRIIATRVADSAQTLEQALSSVTPPRSATQHRFSLRDAWRELVVSHGHELPFIALTAFIVTLVTLRVSVWVTDPSDHVLFELLRTAYTTGFVLVFASTATSLLRFRRRLQRLLAVLYGIGFALILNELSVFLAFDTFYLDMTRRDPNLVFNVQALYQRQESEWAIVVMLAVLIQLTFLRRFYQRLIFVLSLRLRRLGAIGRA